MTFKNNGDSMQDKLNPRQESTQPRFAVWLGDKHFAHLAPEMSQEEDLKQELEDLQAEHRALDQKISILAQEQIIDHMTLQSYKKQKLSLKDKIADVQSNLLPDIIA